MAAGSFPGEDFLHYLWRMKKLDLQDLHTTAGETLHILQFGEYHRDAGPDFAHARIVMGDTQWAGHVEMHVLASDWRRHGHNADPAYRNVILHVVYEADEIVCDPQGRPIPCLELKRRIPPLLYRQYRELQRQEDWIPCAPLIGDVPLSVREMWLARLTIERLEEKSAAMARTLDMLQNDWEETLYRHIAYSFGIPVNSEAFYQLACVAPLRLIGHSRHDLLQLEALLFGQAGLLEAPGGEEYPERLAREYGYLRHKFGLEPLGAGTWKFLRMRPAGFPTLRIAQLASLLHRSSTLWESVLMNEQMAAIYAVLQAPASGYWHSHYTFGHPSPYREKIPGREMVHRCAINTLAPMLFLYGDRKGDDRYKEKAVQWLEQLPAERHHITRKWAETGITALDAAGSQALFQLKNSYCRHKRCLECAIGHSILNK